MSNKRVLYTKVPVKVPQYDEEPQIAADILNIIWYVSRKITEGSIRDNRRSRLLKKLSRDNYHSRTLFTVFCRFWKDIDYDLCALFVDSGMKYHEDILLKNKYVSLDSIYVLLWQYDLDLQLKPEERETQFKKAFVFSLSIDSICINARLQKKFLRTVAAMNVTNCNRIIEGAEGANEYKYKILGPISSYDLDRLTRAKNDNSCGLSDYDIINAFRRLAFKKTDYKFALEYIKANDKITGTAIGTIPRNIDALKYVETVGHGYSDRILLEEFMDHNTECLQYILKCRGIKHYEKLIYGYYWDNPQFTVDRLKSARLLVSHGFYCPTMNKILRHDLEFCRKNLLDGMETLDSIFGDILAARKKIDSRRSFSGHEDISIVC